MGAAAFAGFLAAVAVSCGHAHELHQPPPCLVGEADDASCDTHMSLLQGATRVTPVVLAQGVPGKKTPEASVDVALSEEELACVADILPRLSDSNDECTDECGSLPAMSMNESLFISGSQLQHYMHHVRRPSVNTICETGFYVGQSAMMWLCINPHATLYSFDLEFPTQSLEALRTAFGQRFVHFEGDSMQTLADFAAQPEPPACDVMIQDGGHYGEVPEADLMNFAALAARAPEVERVLLVDEVFYSHAAIIQDDRIAREDDCCPAVTELIVNKTYAGAFDSRRSRCFSRNTNSTGEVVVETEAFEVTPAGLKAMEPVEAQLGGWCELAFAPEFLAGVVA